MLSSIRKRFPDLYAVHVRKAREREQRARAARIAQILADATPPSPIDDDSTLGRLLARRLPGPAPYEYDALTLWLRAAERVARLASLGLLTDRPRRILEVCGGDGTLSEVLADLGHEVMMVDGRDWRAARAREIPFQVVNVDHGLPFATDEFDLVVSYNAFEHVGAPPAVLSEMVRVCRPGGHVMLSFGPLYASPFGLHAWSIPLPWPQYLLSERLREQALHSQKLNDLGSVLDELQPTNGWLIKQYRALWAESGCEIERMTEEEDHRFLDLVLEFPEAFRGRGLDFEDLVKNSIEIVLTPRAR